METSPCATSVPASRNGVLLNPRRPSLLLLLPAAILAIAGCGAPRTSPDTALPLRDHQPEAASELLTTLTDSTTADSPRPVGPTSGLSSSGLAPTQNSALVDGLSAWQNFRSGPRGSTSSGVRSGAVYGEAAVRNLRIAPQSFSADTPAAGAMTAAETRAGSTGRPHGALSGSLRESAWAATNPFSTVTRYNNGAPTATFVKPDDSLGQLGGRVGFRVTKRVQAFASYEAQLRTDSIISTPATPGFFSLTPTQLGLLGTRGVTIAQTHAGLNYLDSLLGTVDRSSSRSLAFVRLDAEPTARDHVTAAYTLHRFRSPAGSQFTSAAESTMARGRASAGDELLDIDALTAASQHLFTPRFLADTRFQLSRDLEQQSPRAPLAQEPAISPGALAPEVSIGQPSFLYGTPSTLGRAAYPDEHRLQLVETLGYTRARTQWQLGADWSRLTDLISTTRNTEGTFSYSSSAANGHAGGLVDWMTDYTYGVNAYPNGACPSINAAVHKFCFRSFTQSFGGSDTQWTTHDLAAFAQGTTQFPHALSLTAGLRWEYTLLPLPQNPNLALDAALRGIGARGFTSQFPEDRNNFGPRLALTWARRALTIHVGYGLFFGRLPGATVLAALTNTALPTSVRSVRITPSTETPCPQVPTVGFGFPCAFTAAPPAAVLSTTSATVFDRSFRLPAVQRLSLSLDGAPAKHLALHAAYAAALAQQLPTSVDLNLSPATTARSFVLVTGDNAHAGVAAGTTFTLPLYTARPLTGYGPVSDLRSSANATYHSATAQVHFTKGPLALTASYTFSHTIDYNPRLAAAPSLMTQLDPFTGGYDKGRASLDFPHRFAGTLVLTSSLGHGPQLLRTALTGFHLAAIGSTTSGAPYSYIVFGGSELTGGRESLNAAGGATYLPTVGRNTLRLPARGRTDLRLARDLALPHEFTLTLAAEAFNLLNNNSVTRVETRAFTAVDPATPASPSQLVFNSVSTTETPAFGTPLSSTAGLSRERLLELSFRVSF